MSKGVASYRHAPIIALMQRACTYYTRTRSQALKCRVRQKQTAMKYEIIKHEVKKFGYFAHEKKITRIETIETCDSLSSAISFLRGMQYTLKMYPEITDVRISEENVLHFTFIPDNGRAMNFIYTIVETK